MVELQKLVSFYRNKRILITGVGGTVGKALLTRFLSIGPKGIVGVDRNEEGTFNLVESEVGHAPNVIINTGDTLDLNHLMRLMEGVDVIFHTAAYKHVLLGEMSPRPLIDTNIRGLQNVIDASISMGVKYTIFTSSDKAVNPTNVMGTSKLLGERLVTAANVQAYNSNVLFASVRFGNLIGSSGSVLPTWLHLLETGRPLTLTDERMTRFFMTISEAVDLILQVPLLACGGEVFVTKMPVFRIKDLLDAVINEWRDQKNLKSFSPEVIITGARPGEKFQEELLTEEEVRRTWETDHFFIVRPAFIAAKHITYGYPDLDVSPAHRVYTSGSQPTLSVEAIREYLRFNGLIA